MIDVCIEAVENKQNGNYEIPLKINSQTINIKFDNGASYTIISASVLDNYFSDEKAARIAMVLSQKADEYKNRHDINKAPFEKSFISASGDELKGYLVDAHDIRIGNVNLKHFYYYLIPQNKRAVALLGNDFLKYCEYTHKIKGNMYITKIDIESYEKYYDKAISIDELSELIDEITLGNEIDGIDTLDVFEDR